MNRFAVFTKGIVRENPVLVFLLGMCPALAVSSQVSSAIGMGAATTFVLLCSNIVISLLRKVIPDKVRIPCYIVFTAGFVTLVQMVAEAYAYPLYQALGIFLPLIAVNCIIFARAEVFARRNGVLDSALDAAGMGAGFTLALVVMATVREILGSGTWMGYALPMLSEAHIPVFAMAPGGFAVFGLLIAGVNKFMKGKKSGPGETGCADCPSASVCGKGAAG